MITAVDTNVLIDVFANDPTFGHPSADRLRECLRDGAVVACEVVWSETCSVFPSEVAFQEQMKDLGIRYSPLEGASALLAGRIWRDYRAAGGLKNRVVADFLIAAHAQLQCDHLLTRDRGFYRSLFRNLKIVEPKP